MIEYENEQGLENLANAIILQACKDYKAALKSKRGATREGGSIRSIQRFFHSQWFKTLTKADPDYIMKEIERQVQEEKEKDKKCYSRYIMGE